MENNTAKHFVLQLGSLASLYLSLTFLLVLSFGLIDILFPDSLDGYWQVESARSMIRIGIAMTIVFFPTYLILTRIVNKLRRNETQGKYLALTKWLIYLSLLGGGLVLLINLVVVIMTFLEGEITERFILKALSVLVTIGLAFFYYIKDAQGYWLRKEKLSILFGGVVTLIVTVAIVAGGLNIETPKEVREQKTDEAQVNELRELQWAIENYITVNGELPANLEALEQTVPTAQEDRAPYRYELRDTGFALCAEFMTDAEEPRWSYPVPDKDQVIINRDNWQYEAGNWCFERVVNHPSPALD